MDGADLRAVAELQYERDEVDEDRDVQLVDVVQLRVAHVADEETEVHRGGQQHEEAEDDFFEVHA